MSMRISPVSNLAFQKLGMHKASNNMKVIDPIGYSAKNGTYYTLTPHDYYENVFDFSFDTKDKETPDSHEEVAITPYYLSVMEMFTLPDARKQRMAETLHLINIIEMLENNIPYIDLDATAEAVPYHAKIGFKCDEKWFNGLRGTLIDIQNSDLEFADEIKMLRDAKIDRCEKEKIGNAIVDKYIAKALKNVPKDELKYFMNSYLHMILTKDDVIQNKDFYNKLFKKNNLDYQID